MSYANDMTGQTTSDDASLASELRLSVMRLRRRLVSERDPENELSIGSMAVLGGLEINGDAFASEEYRAHLLGVLLKQAIADARS